jgi:serine protease Do
MKRAAVVFGLGLMVFFGGSMTRLPISAQSRAPLAAPASADPLQALSDRFEAIAAKVAPAVVAVEAVKPPKVAATGKKNIEESGSGVILKIDGRPGYVVVTNNHVVSEAPPEKITVHAADGRLFRPSQVLSDPETDIALLVLEAATNLTAATLGNSDHAKVGRWVLAIGSPFGLNQSVTHGIISARDRGQVNLGSSIRIKEFLQTDAAINPGSSGGPLVDLQGEVIGINTAIASHNGNNSGVAFAIPSSLVKRVVNQMLQNGGIQRGYLGMQLSSGFEANDAIRLGLDRVHGALVEKVYPETPAALAGLKPNDVILQVESIAIRSENHLINLISNLPAGQRIRMQVWRDRSMVNLDATIGDWSKGQTRLQSE